MLFLYHESYSFVSHLVFLRLQNSPYLQGGCKRMRESEHTNLLHEWIWYKFPNICNTCTCWQITRFTHIIHALTHSWVQQSFSHATIKFSAAYLSCTTPSTFKATLQLSKASCSPPHHQLSPGTTLLSLMTQCCQHLSIYTTRHLCIYKTDKDALCLASVIWEETAAVTLL